jgi:hypothetical protein
MEGDGSHVKKRERMGSVGFFNCSFGIFEEYTIF